MKLSFYKYQGTGNDFILIDNRNNAIQKDSFSVSVIQYLCHRQLGIGSDGLMLLENSNKADFRMRFYNPDGSEGMMCGNGGRCIVAFASYLQIIGSETTFEAPDGLHFAKVLDDGNIELQMNNVDNIQQNTDFTYLNTGAPHHIIFEDKSNVADILTEARKIRYSPVYAHQNGTNVNYAWLNNNQLWLRTYERGVENETLSCGTGVVATAIASSMKFSNITSPVTVNTKGGVLKVSFTHENGYIQNIWLNGPAVQVFSGTISFDF